MVGNDPVDFLDSLGLSKWECECIDDVGNKKLKSIEYSILEGSLESQGESMMGKAGSTATGVAASQALKFAVNNVDRTPLGEIAKSNFSTNYGGYRGKYKGEYYICENGGSGVKWSDKQEFSGIADGVSSNEFYATPHEALAGAKEKASDHWNSL